MSLDESNNNYIIIVAQLDEDGLFELIRTSQISATDQKLLAKKVFVQFDLNFLFLKTFKAKEKEEKGKFCVV